MARWLLSGHNPQETFGVSYRISSSYIAEFMGQRPLEYVIASLAGSTAEIDRSLIFMPSVHGRPYANVNYFVRNVGLAFPFDPAAIGVPRGLLTSERRFRLGTLLLLPWRFWRMYRRAMRAYRHVIPRYREELGRIYWQLRAGDDERPSEDLALIARLFEPTMVEYASAFATLLVVAGLPNIGVLGWVNQRAPALLNLLVGYGTSTAQLGARMWELRQVAEDCGLETIALLRRGETDLAAYRQIPAAAPLLTALERFMREYGHRAFHYASEFESPRLADQPQLVLLAVGGLLEEKEPPAARAAVARDAGLRALQGMNPLRRLFWSRMLKLGSALIERREENRDTMELQNATYGLAARILARRYFPDQPPDYLWLYTFDEFLQFGRSQGRARVDPAEVARRRAELERHRAQATPPELIWYDPETQQWWPVEQEAAVAQAGPGKVVLHGIGTSAGSGPVEGIAMVTDSAQEAAERLLWSKGPVVLVTHVTDPVWSSLFRRLTAVVTEMGGAISHAAVIARETGIPAVVGVQNALRRIRDGQWVRVDGAAGTVEALDGAGPLPAAVPPRFGERAESPRPSAERKAGAGQPRHGQGQR